MISTQEGGKLLIMVDSPRSQSCQAVWIVNNKEMKFIMQNRLSIIYWNRKEQWLLGIQLSQTVTYFVYIISSNKLNGVDIHAYWLLLQIQIKMFSPPTIGVLSRLVERMRSVGSSASAGPSNCHLHPVDDVFLLPHLCNGVNWKDYVVEPLWVPWCAM